MTRLIEALQHLSAEFSLSRHEAQRDFAPQGDMVIDGLLSQGWVNAKDGRIAPSAQGIKALEAHSGPAE